MVFLAGPDEEKIKEYFHFVVQNRWWEYVMNQSNPMETVEHLKGLHVIWLAVLV